MKTALGISLISFERQQRFFTHSRLLCVLFSTLMLVFAGTCAWAEVPLELKPWLGEQTWERDVAGPIVSLGQPGEFDDTHLFAPAVAYENGRFQLWYCGSTGTVAERVFNLGLANSKDGREFSKHKGNPVFRFGDGKHSILTPTLLRNADGTTLREDGQLRMWFSSTWFSGSTGLHTLHETTSTDGIHWQTPSAAQLEHVYAPTIIKTGRFYQMWYIDVSARPWIIRHAYSEDGRKWRVKPEPVIELTQDWETQNLFYPTVVKIGDAYLMWYGSYWAERRNTTALGFAVSLDGMQWYKHPQNPVLRPDPNRPWESNYVTSQSVMQTADNELRIWYASRKRPPFVNKYFALNTARWSLPPKKPVAAVTKAKHLADPTTFAAWQQATRKKLSDMLGLPQQRVPLNAEKRGQTERDGIVIEKWIFTSEPGSRVPAVLYRPKAPAAPMPALVLTFGHGGSKSQWQYNYAGQMYAKAGLAVLAIDPIGEEERHDQGRLGTRAHDPKPVHDRADQAGRLIMGKLVFDTMRGIDWLMERSDIDHDRIGVAGNSLGGAKAGWMAALEPRIKLAIVSGWAFDDITLRSKYCTMVPNQRMRELCTWEEYAALAAPQCAVLVANGDGDGIIDRENDGAAWAGTQSVIDEAANVYALLGAPGKIQAHFVKDGGHRPYFIEKHALEWVHRHLGTPGMTLDEIHALPTINSGVWCDAHGIRLEKLYGTELHQRGATLPNFELHPTPRGVLSCLKPGELGLAEFTVAGWLQKIESQAKSAAAKAESGGQ